jgi:K+-transporting ATPase KdpF subunit
MRLDTLLGGVVPFGFLVYLAARVLNSGPWNSDPVATVRQCCRSAPEGGICMLLDYLLGGLVAFGLLVYLVYALLRPERF